MNDRKMCLNHLAALLLMLSVFFPTQAQILNELPEQLRNNFESNNFAAQTNANSVENGERQLVPRRRGAPKGNQNARGNRGNRICGEVRMISRFGKAKGGAPR